MNTDTDTLAPVGLLGGTGEEGRGIVLRLAQAGVPVILGSRSAERAQNLGTELNTRVGSSLIRGAANESLFEVCQILFLSVPFSCAKDLLKSMQTFFKEGHILVDVTVPLYFEKGPRLFDLAEGSGCEHLRRHLPEMVPLVGTFKTLPAHLLSHLETPLDCDEFVVSDSPRAREKVVETLSRIQGLRWLNAGPLRYARALEGMTLLAVSLNRRYKSREGCYRFLK